jgi:hypothetical protein
VEFNERKHQTLAFLSRREWIRPREYGAAVGFYPTRAAFTYLLRLQRMGLLHRGRDFSGHIVYRLSPRGARWLLRVERGE